MTIKAWLADAAARLDAEGISSASMEAHILLAHAMDRDRVFLFAHPSAEAPLVADGLMRRRLAGEPLAYITGYREFFGRRFAVNPSVLIPRHETEVLVETALRLLPVRAGVLDVGTGSGCIAVTLKLERPDLRVQAIDISDAALSTASANAAALEADVEFLLGDLLPREGRFDAVVSNPPYVAPGDPLPPEISEYEPGLALFAEEDGLAFYRRLAVEGRSRTALMIVELGDGMAERIGARFLEAGWGVSETVRDLGEMERVMVFCI